MHISIITRQDSFRLFRCMEDGDPQDPANNYGAKIDMDDDGIVDPAYYVLLSTGMPA